MNTSLFFDSFFNTAKQNAIMILDEHGIVLKVNKAFTDAFGYLNEDITEQNFRLTFIDKDRKMNKPEMELQTVKSRGSAEDENYILHNDGTPIWTTGESILVNAENTIYIMKVIQNIHRKSNWKDFFLNQMNLLKAFLILLKMQHSLFLIV